MSSPMIKKELLNYINSSVFITNLNIPLFESDVKSDEENMILIRDRLTMLLKLPHRVFWCHILFDKSVLRSLESFFMFAKRPYELLIHNSSLSSSEGELYKLFYRFIIRICTHKEIDVPEFSSINFGSLIYENYIIDVPAMFDICSIFGEDNPEMVGKMLCGVLSCQDLYINDIRDYVANSVRLVNEKIQNISTNGTPRSNESTKDKVNQHLLKKAFPSKIEDIDLLYYFLDFSRTWSIFLHCIEPKKEIFDMFMELQFHKVIEKLFEKIVPIIQRKLEKFDTKDPEVIKQLLSLMCYYLIDIWRTIFKILYIDKMNDKKSRSSEENYSLISASVAMISGCQENSSFVDAMYLIYPIEEDLKLIDTTIKSDEHEYYSEYVNETLDEIKKSILSRNTLFSKNVFELNGLSSTEPISNNSDNPETCDVAQIVDIYPDLSTQDIRTYMKMYSCSSVFMLESLLEGAINTEFVHQEAAKYRNASQNTASEDDFYIDSILSNHKNIYDGDELDTGNIKSSQIHQGKRQKNVNSIVDLELRQMILGIVDRQNVEDSERVVDNDNMMYNDEFDDVYGISHDGIVNEKDSEEEEVAVVKEQKVTAPLTRNDGDKTENTGNGSRAQRAHRLQNTGNRTAVATVSSINVVVEPVLMEPSDVRYSNYHKNQNTKKRFQDSHRLAEQKGTGTGKVNRDHRPKGARNKEE